MKGCRQSLSKYLRVPLGALLALALVTMSSCWWGNGSPSPPAPAPAVQACTLGTQAEVLVPGTSNYSGAGGVTVAATLVSTVGSSNCPGSLTNDGGTANAFGVWNGTADRMNADWDVAWSWADTSWSGCGLQTQGPDFCPDTGCVAVDQCAY